MDYMFEQTQKLKFVMWDCDAANSSLAGADLIGELEITLAEIIGQAGGCLTKPLSPAGRGF
jgi:hypothetical protein